MSKHSRSTSLVWKVIKRPNEKNVVVCTLCNKRMNFFGTTTNLRYHLIKTHNYFKVIENGKVSEEHSNAESKNSPCSHETGLNASEPQDNLSNSVDHHEDDEENNYEELKQPKIVPQTKPLIIMPEKRVINQKPRPMVLKSYDDHKSYCRTTVRERGGKDEFDIYGEYLALKLRSLDKMSCLYVQKAFNDTLFDAEMGKYSVPQNVVEVNYVPEENNHETASSPATSVQILQGSTTSLATDSIQTSF